MQTDVCDLSVNTTWKGFCSGGLPALTARAPTYCTVQRSDNTETQVLMFPTSVYSQIILIIYKLLFIYFILYLFVFQCLFLEI